MNETREDLPVRRQGPEIKEILLLIVLSVSLFLSILFVPVAGFFLSALTPAPTALSIVRREGAKAWIVPGCSAAVGSLILVLLGLPESIPYLLGLVAMGAVIGYGFRLGWSASKIVGFSSLLVVGLAALLALFAYIRTKGQMVHLIEQDIRDVITAAMKQLSAGSSVETKEMEKGLLEMVSPLVRMMPGIFISSMLMISWVNLLVCRRYCRGPAGGGQEQERLCLWKSPEHLVWLVIAGGLMLLLPWSAFSLLGINLVLVMGTVYFFQGLAIVAFYFEKWRAPLFVKGFVYAVFFLERIASMAVAALGLFDVWFDFRRHNKQA
ncbi:MAG: DUF2232 domain-containing protein [Syntrophobacteraceae bacterium]|nr:DUF2232 domain-containing protein [Syntrophobacteraceae bacterium]